MIASLGRNLILTLTRVSHIDDASQLLDDKKVVEF